MSSQPLHLKYRPKTFDEVVGQDEVVKSLQRTLASATVPHTYLFTGPSGCGKTTLARIVARELGCGDVIEMDAATNTGIDASRAITEMTRYQAFGERPNKAVILDECHGLTKQAWNALLKLVEEPPPHIYFAFCTTERAKVPETIVTRCAVYDLRRVPRQDLKALLLFVTQEEGLGTPDKFLDMIITAADGSPRKALVMLGMVFACDSEQEVERILSTVGEEAELITLLRAMVSGRGFSWALVSKTLNSMREQDPEGIRIQIVNYLNSCVLNARAERDVPALLDLLYRFSRPINPADKMAPILLAFGEILFPPK